jgi:hypothetical protein
MTAFWGFTVLMVLIIASGHYGFFNLLTLALCVTLIDDASWPSRLRTVRSTSPGLPRAQRVQRRLLPWIATPLLLATTAQLLMVLRVVSPASLGPWLGPLVPFRSANSYGLFSVMTTERPEITIEASTNGTDWQTLAFRHKMSPATTSMPYFLPHMPRLDWQMWFAALEYRASGQPPAWIMPLLARLQEQSPPVLGLLAGQTPGPAPTFFRLRLDLLEFSTPAERSASGRYWKSSALPAYTIEGSLQR